MRRFCASEPWLVVLTAGTAVIEAVSSVIRHIHFQSGLDLALADQALWHYSRFEAPFSSLLHKNVLGDHFSPLVAVLSPLYWVWSDPRMLLIAQSVLVAGSIVPVFLFARERLSRANAYLLSAAYATYWGLQVGVLYDFHELAFAPLLLALSILLADRRRWPWFWLVIALLLAVKEDLSILVVFFGLYLLTLRVWRHGVALIVVGIASYEVLTRALIPELANGAPYSHWTYQELGKNLPDALGTLVTHPWRLLTIAFSTTQKARTIARLLAPFLFLSLGSRIFILALPLLAERFLSTDPDFWSGHYHYSMAIAPVLAMAACAGLANLSALTAARSRWRASASVLAAMALLASVGITEVGSSHNSALAVLTRSGFYETPGFARGVERALARIPAAASVESNDYLLPHLSQRRQLQLIDPVDAGRTEYLITRVLPPPVCCTTGSGTQAALDQVVNKELAAMAPVFFGSGWLVARRTGHPANGVLSPISGAQASALRRESQALRTASLALAGCSEKWRAADPGAAGCFRKVGERFMSTAAGLERVLARGSVGGCAELSHAVSDEVSALASYVQRVAQAGSAPDRKLLPRQGAALQAFEAQTDAIGHLEQLLVLCAPRY